MERFTKSRITTFAAAGVLAVGITAAVTTFAASTEDDAPEIPVPSPTFEAGRAGTSY
ncbi:MAG: hypothetical protein WD926_00310 [Patescibacteria group bacterium]